eukprot:953884-Pelagomonas_calceolata.AAC.2
MSAVGAAAAAAGAGDQAGVRVFRCLGSVHEPGWCCLASAWEGVGMLRCLGSVCRGSAWAGVSVEVGMHDCPCV